MTDFEIIGEDEFKKAQEKKPRATGSPRKRGATKLFNTDDRTKTGWYKLPHTMGYCTVPSHDEVQKALKPEAKAYRQRYPVRMVFQIGEYTVCRDCYLARADEPE